nr:pentatricopeptide repeat-containing protein [Tanacetum cinerariifolium]
CHLLIHNVHYDGTFNFTPLRYENDLVYQWSVRKDNELDLELYDGNISVEELLSWAGEETIMASKGCNDDICVTSVLDKGKGLADKGKWLVDKGKGIMVDKWKVGRKTARSSNSGIVIGENVNLTFSEDDDFDSDICMEQRFKGSAQLEEIYKGNTDSETEYFDKSADYLSDGEHEEYIDKLMHQLRDKGDCLTGPLIILENDQSNEKFPIHDEQTHWKIRKPKVGKKHANTKALNEGEITTEEHYAMIRTYGKEILDSNDGSTLKLGVTINPDVINVENKDSWSWFLELLGEDIDMPTGLIEDVKDVMPLAKHRQCARHIYEGFRKQYSGVEFRELFWVRGRPKKNVANVELGGDATIHMDESSSQVRQGGVATGINVGSVGVEADINVGLARVEDGTTTATTSRGRVGVKRGRGGKTVGLGVKRVTSEGTPAVHKTLYGMYVVKV